MKQSLQILVLILFALGSSDAQTVFDNISEFKKKLTDGIHSKGLKHSEKMAQLNLITQNMKPFDLKYRLDSFVFYDSTAMLNSFKIYYFYDSKQRNTVMDFYFWDNAAKKFMGFDHVGFVYNSKNQIIETQDGKWNNQTNVFDPNYKTLNQYNANGILIKDSTYVLEGGSWMLYEKTEYTIVNGKVSVSIEYEYDGVEWVKYSKSEYKYDGSGNLIEEVSYYWDESSESWEGDDKILYTYNANNKITEQTILKWDFNTSKFINDVRFQTGFNAEGLKISQLQLEWDVQISQWVNNELFEVSYTQAKNPDKILIYSWNKTKMAWDNINLFLNHFDESVKQNSLILPVLDIFSVLFQFDAFANGRPLTVAYNEIKKPNGEWARRNQITFHYSQHQVSSLSEIRKNTLNIYPNPIKEQLICESEIENGFYTISSIQGITKANGIYVKGESIPVSDLPAGMYIFLLHDKQKQPAQTSFIKL